MMNDVSVFLQSRHESNQMVVIVYRCYDTVRNVVYTMMNDVSVFLQSRHESNQMVVIVYRC